jgi:tetratricopeptide (TPR) repeat protein
MLADRLADERRRLDELAAGDLEVRASVGLSYRALGTDERRAMRRIGMLGVLDFGAWIIGPLTQLPQARGDAVLERLTDAHLLEVASVDRAGQVRYRMHELLQVYARERAEVEDPVAERADVVTRVLGSWLSLIGLIAAHTPSGEVDLLTTYGTAQPVSAEVSAAALADPAAWLEAETPSLVSALERAATLGLDDVVFEVAAALSSSGFVVANQFDAWSRSHAAALATTHQVGNQRREATLLVGLGRLRREQDSYPEAVACFREALLLFEAAGDVRGQALALSGLGDVSRELGQLQDSRRQLAAALDTFRSLGDDAGIGFCARRVGAICIECGAQDDGMVALDEALMVYRRLGSRRGEAITLRTIGLALRAVGAFDAAAEVSGRAVAILADIGDTLMHAYAVQALEKARFRRGDTASASAALAQALATCRAYRDRFGEALVLRTIGELQVVLGELDCARSALEESLAIWEQLGQPLFAARTLRDLATVAEADDAPELAAATRARAIGVFARFGTREQGELGDSGEFGDPAVVGAKLQRT